MVVIPYQTGTQVDAYAEALSSFRLAGGQFSSRMPRDKPRAANTSLISFKDFLPRFGVFSSCFRALNQITDVVDILGFEAVSAAYGQLEIVYGAQ